MQLTAIAAVSRYLPCLQNEETVDGRRKTAEKPVRAASTIMRWSSKAEPHRTMSKTIIYAMKLTFLLLTVAALQVSATGHSQKVTLSLKNAPIERVFREIQKQTDIGFLFTKQMLQKTRPVTIDVKDVPVEDALMICFQNQPISFSLINNNIVVAEKKELLQLVDKSSSSDPPQIDVRGRIVNENGEPVIATVMVKRTKTGTTTNAKGEFQLSGIDENAVLVISGVSIEPMEVAVAKNPGLKSRDGLTITATTAITTLNEIVINKGYYTEKQKYSVSNVGRVTAKEIEKQPVANPLSTIQGLVPGLLVEHQSGLPGGAVKVQIRGQNSIRQGSNPLFIVDGVPFAASEDNAAVTGMLSINLQNAFSFINPADIESIEVLKDADATAIYGSRGANGVILITTKKGKAGSPIVEAGFYSGFSKVVSVPELLNTRQYLEMRREAFANDGITPNVNNAPDLLVWDTTRYTDWAKYVMGNTAHTTQGNVRFSGGNDKTHFSASATYQDASTVFPTEFGNEKLGAHANLNHLSGNRKLGINLSIGFVHDSNRLPEGLTSPSSSISLAPNAPAAFDTNGKLNWENGTFSNPFTGLLRPYIGKTDNVVTNTQLNYSLLQGLDLKLSVGYNVTSSDEMRAVPKSTFSPASSGKAYSTFSFGKWQTWIVEPQISYRRAIGEGQLQLLAGSSWQDRKYKNHTISAREYANDDLLQDMTAAGSYYVYNNFSQYRYEGIFGRLSYNHKNRYLLNISGRRDGSSRFGPDKRFALFSAAGAGWIFSEENSIKQGLPWLSFGKLRASYGTSGNDQIGDYQYLDTWSNSYTSPYQGVPALVPDGIFNPDYNWERTRKLEVGLELGVLNNDILLSVSYYCNRSSNQLVSFGLPRQTGFRSLTMNRDALMQNTGLEFDIQSLNFDKAGFRWNTSFNLTIPRNKLLAYPGLEGTSQRYFYIIGAPIGSSYYYQFTGLDPLTGIYTVRDVNNDGVIDRDDDYLPYRIEPVSYFGGLTNSIQVRDFQLDFTFYFTKQTGKLRELTSYPGMMNNQPVYVMDRWQKPGDIALFPRFSTSRSSDAYKGHYNSTNSDHAIQDFGFARLRNLSVAYNLPAKLCKRIGVKNFNVYARGQNLLTFSSFKTYDPEIRDPMSIPPLRTIVLGFNLSL